MSPLIIEDVGGGGGRGVSRTREERPLGSPRVVVRLEGKRKSDVKREERRLVRKP